MIATASKTSPLLLALAMLGIAPGLTARAESRDPMVHLRALQEIAVSSGGSRAALTPGYERSVQYVSAQLRQMGYQVRIEDFSFPMSEERSPPALLMGSARQPAAQEDVRSFIYSGTGDVTAPVRAVNLGLAPEGPPQASTSGCSAADFAGFERGAIALVRRGTCPFFVKVQNASAAGASAVIAMNEGTTGQTESFSASLGRPVPIPIVGISYALGRSLADLAAKPEEATVRLTLDILTPTRTSQNVLAELPASPGDERPFVVVGAHLDSVRDGPGVNDNGSGAAALLVAAARIKDAANGSMRVRFAFWGAEEIGLIGSREYVTRLPEEERKRIGLYINLDMVGSRNFSRWVLADPEVTGPAAVGAKAMQDHFAARPAPAERRPLGPLGTYSTDMAPFKQGGIAAIGLFTGAGELKSESHAALFGGQAGQPHDACYHRSCDTIDNIDPAVLDQMAGALTDALRAVTNSRP